MCGVGVWDKELTDIKSASSRASRIVNALKARLPDATIAIEDESHRHAGHAGASAEGETHYRLRIVAAAFTGLTRVARHRLINDALAAEFKAGLHALALELKSPTEIQ